LPVSSVSRRSPRKGLYCKHSKFYLVGAGLVVFFFFSPPKGFPVVSFPPQFPTDSPIFLLRFCVVCSSSCPSPFFLLQRASPFLLTAVDLITVFAFAYLSLRLRRLHEVSPLLPEAVFPHLSECLAADLLHALCAVFLNPLEKEYPSSYLPFFPTATPVRFPTPEGHFSAVPPFVQALPFSSLAETLARNPFFPNSLFSSFPFPPKVSKSSSLTQCSFSSPSI